MSRRTLPEAKQTAPQVAEVKGTAVPKEAAERIMRATAEAAQAQKHAAELIEGIAAALCVPVGSNLVQVEGGDLYFMPPAPKPAVLPESEQETLRD